MLSPRRRTRSSLKMDPDNPESSMVAGSPKRKKPRCSDEVLKNLKMMTPVAAKEKALVTPTKKKATNSPVRSPRAPRKAPKDWLDTYRLVEELRQDRSAPCDHSGAEALALLDGADNSEEGARLFRFRSLMALMLSSQTKDAVVAEAVRSMHEGGVLSVDAMSKLNAEEIDNYIRRVGFHNNKTKYIQEAMKILQRDYNGDIPPTADEMMKLPGVGPKMAYICENISWGTASGIGVDTHMHRLFNKLKWVESKTPEQTRLQLQDWLPVEYWPEVNLLWVGFGQEVQQFAPKILQKALKCSRPADAIRLLKRCGMNVTQEAKKAGLADMLKHAS